MTIRRLRNLIVDGVAYISVLAEIQMRQISILTLIILTLTNCSENRQKKQTIYAPNGTLLTFDTLSNKYLISKDDIKLIATWTLFKKALSTNDFEDLKQLSTDSIICPNCGIHNENYSITTIDTFFKNFASDIFSKSFVNLMFDSSKIRCSYDYDSSYLYAYPYLTTISNIAKPKVAQIFVSFPLRSGETEGTSAIFGFIVTKASYKFFCYSTMP
jgi:hypothetical protein